MIFYVSYPVIVTRLICLQIMSGIYVSVSKASKSFINCDLDTAVVLFIYKYLRSNSEMIPHLYLVVDETLDGNFELHSSEFIYSSKLPDEIDQVLDNCMFPVYYQAEQKYCVAGLCAVLRQVSNRSILSPVLFVSLFLN